MYTAVSEQVQLMNMVNEQVYVMNDGFALTSKEQKKLIANEETINEIQDSLIDQTKEMKLSETDRAVVVGGINALFDDQIKLLALLNTAQQRELATSLAIEFQEKSRGAILKRTKNLALDQEVTLNRQKEALSAQTEELGIQYRGALAKQAILKAESASGEKIEAIQKRITEIFSNRVALAKELAQIRLNIVNFEHQVQQEILRGNEAMNQQVNYGQDRVSQTRATIINQREIAKEEIRYLNHLQKEGFIGENARIIEAKKAQLKAKLIELTRTENEELFKQNLAIAESSNSLQEQLRGKDKILNIDNESTILTLKIKKLQNDIAVTREKSNKSEYRFGRQLIEQQAELNKLKEREIALAVERIDIETKNRVALIDNLATIEQTRIKLLESFDIIDKIAIKNSEINEISYELASIEEQINGLLAKRGPQLELSKEQQIELTNLVSRYGAKFADLILNKQEDVNKLKQQEINLQNKLLALYIKEADLFGVLGGEIEKALSPFIEAEFDSKPFSTALIAIKALGLSFYEIERLGPQEVMRQLQEGWRNGTASLEGLNSEMLDLALNLRRVGEEEQRLRLIQNDIKDQQFETAFLRINRALAVNDIERATKAFDDLAKAAEILDPTTGKINAAKTAQNLDIVRKKGEEIGAALANAGKEANAGLDAIRLETLKEMERLSVNIKNNLTTGKFGSELVEQLNSFIAALQKLDGATITFKVDNNTTGIKKFHKGGYVGGDLVTSDTTDPAVQEIPALLAKNEYVIPDYAVKALGPAFFERFRNKQFVQKASMIKGNDPFVSIFGDLPRFAGASPYTTDGYVTQGISGNIDSVPASLKVDSFVIPSFAVDAFGPEFFGKLSDPELIHKLKNTNRDRLLNAISYSQFFNQREDIFEEQKRVGYKTGGLVGRGLRTGGLVGGIQRFANGGSVVDDRTKTLTVVFEDEEQQKILVRIESLLKKSQENNEQQRLVEEIIKTATLTDQVVSAVREQELQQQPIAELEKLLVSLKEDLKTEDESAKLVQELSKLGAIAPGDEARILNEFPIDELRSIVNEFNKTKDDSKEKLILVQELSRLGAIAPGDEARVVNEFPIEELRYLLASLNELKDTAPKNIQASTGVTEALPFPPITEIATVTQVAVKNAQQLNVELEKAGAAGDVLESNSNKAAEALAKGAEEASKLSNASGKTIAIIDVKAVEELKKSLEGVSKIDINFINDIEKLAKVLGQTDPKSLSELVEIAQELDLPPEVLKQFENLNKLTDDINLAKFIQMKKDAEPLGNIFLDVAAAIGRVGKNSDFFKEIGSAVSAFRKQVVKANKDIVNFSNKFLSSFGKKAIDAIKAITSAFKTLFTDVLPNLFGLFVNDFAVAAGQVVAQNEEASRNIIDQFNEQRADLVEQLKRNEISYFDYFNKLEDLNKDKDDNMLENSAEIAEELESVFNNFVRNFTDALTGGLIDMAKGFDEFFSGIVDSGIEVANSLFDTFGDLGGLIGQGIGTLAGAGTGAAIGGAAGVAAGPAGLAIGAVIGGVIGEGLKSVVPVVGTILKAFEQMASAAIQSVLAIIPYIVQLATMGDDEFEGMLTALEELPDKIPEYVDNLRERLATIATLFTEVDPATGRTTIQTIIDSLLAALRDSIPAIGEAVRAIIPGTVDSFIRLFAQLAESLPSLFIDIFASIGNAATQAFQNPALYAGISDAIIGIKDVFVSLVKDMLVPLTAVFAGFIPTLIPVLVAAFATAVPEITSAASVLISTFVQVLSSPEITSQITNAIVGMFTSVGSEFTEFNMLFESLGGIVSQVVAQLPNFMSMILSVTSILVSLGALVIDIFTEVFNILGTLLPPILGLLAPIISTLVAAITPILDVVQVLLDAIMAILQPLADALLAIIQPILEAIAPIVTVVDNLLSSLLPLFDMVGNLVEVLGGALVQVLTPVIALLNTLVSVFGETVGMTGGLISAIIGALVPVFNIVTTLLTTLASALTPILGVLSTLLQSVVGAFASVIGVVAVVITALVDNFFVLNPLIATIISLSSVIEPLLMVLSTLIVAVLQPLLNVVNVVLDVLVLFVDALGGALVPIIEIVANSVSLLVTLFMPFIDILVVFAKALVPIVKALEPVIEVLIYALLIPLFAIIVPLLAQLLILAVVLKAITPGIQFVADVLEDMRDVLIVLQEYIAIIVTQIMDELSPAFEFIGGIFEEIGDAIHSWLIEPFTALLIIFSDIEYALFGGSLIPVLEILHNVIVTLSNFIENTFNVVLQTLSNIWTDLGNFLTRTFTPALQTVTTLWAQFSNFVSGTFITVFNAIFTVFQNIGNLISGAFTTAMNVLRDALNTILTPLQEVGNFIKDVFVTALESLFNIVSDIVGLIPDTSAVDETTETIQNNAANAGDHLNNAGEALARGDVGTAITEGGAAIGSFLGFHNGGIFSVPTNPEARQFQEMIGLTAEEGLAILLEGEAILTRAGLSTLGEDNLSKFNKGLNPYTNESYFDRQSGTEFGFPQWLMQLHNGGIFETGRSNRAIAEFYDAIGLRNDEGLAILLEGEGILTTKGVSTLGEENISKFNNGYNPFIESTTGFGAAGFSDRVAYEAAAAGTGLPGVSEAAAVFQAGIVSQNQVQQTDFSDTTDTNEPIYTADAVRENEFGGSTEYTTNDVSVNLTVDMTGASFSGDDIAQQIEQELTNAMQNKEGPLFREIENIVDRDNDRGIRR